MEVSEHLRNLIDSSKLQQNVDLQDVRYTFPKSIQEQKVDILSPTFRVKKSKERSLDSPWSEMRTHAARFSHGSMPKTKLGEADDDSLEKMMSNIEGIHSFKSFLTSMLTCNNSDSVIFFCILDYV
ncbi:hypothetical protein ACH5RR_019929 [Cinchona calisaya]|uniref:Uncharacterized protein n=1 Tax=Cinchona calisaya TaxID=153742 RepID=A0ABD2ZCY6_9GENT